MRVGWSGLELWGGGTVVVEFLGMWGGSSGEWRCWRIGQGLLDVPDSVLTVEVSKALVGGGLPLLFLLLMALTVASLQMRVRGVDVSVLRIRDGFDGDAYKRYVSDYNSVIACISLRIFINHKHIPHHCGFHTRRIASTTRTLREIQNLHLIKSTGSEPPTSSTAPD